MPLVALTAQTAPTPDEPDTAPKEWLPREHAAALTVPCVVEAFKAGTLLEPGDGRALGQLRMLVRYDHAPVSADPVAVRLLPT